MNIEFKGIEDLANALDKASDIPNSIPESTDVENLLTDTFLSTNSEFNSYEEFTTNLGFDLNDAASANTDQLDMFVSEHTNFSNMQDMLDAAFANQIQDQLSDAFR